MYPKRLSSHDWRPSIRWGSPPIIIHKRVVHLPIQFSAATCRIQQARHYTAVEHMSIHSVPLKEEKTQVEYVLHSGEGSTTGSFNVASYTRYSPIIMTAEAPDSEAIAEEKDPSDRCACVYVCRTFVTCNHAVTLLSSESSTGG